MLQNQLFPRLFPKEIPGDFFGRVGDKLGVVPGYKIPKAGTELRERRFGQSIPGSPHSGRPPGKPGLWSRAPGPPAAPGPS